MDFDESYPIYRQIIDDFKKRVVRGELKPGDKIPSQREYAQTARVNPNTVQRAYREMEAMAMVETVRGQGTFIRASEQMVTTIRQEMAQRLLSSFIAEMRSLGYSDQQTLTLVQEAQQETGGRE